MSRRLTKSQQERAIELLEKYDKALKRLDLHIAGVIDYRCPSRVVVQYNEFLKELETT